MQQRRNTFRIGENIIRLRLKLGLSQEDLAIMAGISKYTLSKIESGASDDPRIITLASIAHELDVGVDDLLGLYGNSCQGAQNMLYSSASNKHQPRRMHDQSIR